MSEAIAAAAGELDTSRPDLHAVVSWVSAHAATLEHVVFPAARRHLPHRRATTDTDVEVARSLEHVLHQLHQDLNGDARGAGDMGRAVTRLAQLLELHTARQEQLVDELRDALPERDWAELVTQYEAALRRAPSRPHPHVPHTGVAEHVAFAVAAAVDRLLDGLDSQPAAPLPPPAQRAGDDTPLTRSV